MQMLTLSIQRSKLKCVKETTIKTENIWLCDLIVQARVDQRRAIALTLDDVFATWTEFIIDEGKE